MLKLSLTKLNSWKFAFLIFIPLTLSCLTSKMIQAQESTDIDIPDATSETELNQPINEEMRPGMVLSIDGGDKLTLEAEEAIESENYSLAVEKLQGARQIFNQLSNFYLQLAQNFSGIDSKITEESRSKALMSGQKRDETTYQLAIVHRAQDKPELAIPLLLQVIRSQNPTSEMGQKAYQQLYEIGFINTPFSK